MATYGFELLCNYHDECERLIDELESTQQELRDRISTLEDENAELQEELAELTKSKESCTIDGKFHVLRSYFEICRRLVDELEAVLWGSYRENTIAERKNTELEAKIASLSIERSTNE